MQEQAEQPGNMLNWRPDRHLGRYRQIAQVLARHGLGALADALGLEQTDVLDVLVESPIGVTAKSKRKLIESGEYPPNFKLGLAAKDLRLVTSAAEEAGLELRLAPAARAWLERADAEGKGDLDYSAVIASVRGRPAS